METNIGFNTMINNLSNKITQDINESQLPVGIVYLVIKNMFLDIQKVYEETLRAELEQSKIAKDAKIAEEKKK